MDYEYTVVEPFSLGTKSFRVGDRLTDQHTIDQALAGGHVRALTRHDVLTPPKAVQKPEQDEAEKPAQESAKN